MAPAAYRRFAGFYFFYFAWLGAFAPFFTLYLQGVGRTASEIGILMALPAFSRIVAPHLWGWLADTRARPALLLRASACAALLCFLGVLAGSAFAWLLVVLAAATFFLSAALPLVEAATLAQLGADTGRYGPVRVWGSLGYIAAVAGVGHALDRIAVESLPWILAALLAGTLVFSWSLPAAGAGPHAPGEPPILRVLERPEVVALIAACALMAAAHGPYYTFYSIHLVGHGYSKALTGWLWALGVICEIGVFIWLPQLFRAASLRAILLASFALAAARFLVIGWLADSLAALVLAQTLHAASFGSFHAAAIAVVHRLFRGRNQARGQAIYGSLTFGLGGAAGGLASGYAWEAIGPAPTFTLGAVCALAGMGLIAWKFREREP
ncbi:MAG TPA: MFS transporter [Burkholderiales bacterium]|nr:MFS transporter [Burkholderiales bacterium]